MKKGRGYHVGYPQAVNADNQAVEVIHREIDPLGSYTGRPEDGGKPVQDADDL